MYSKEYFTDFEYTDFDLFISSLKHLLKLMGAEAFIHKQESKPVIAEKHKLLYLFSMIKTIGKQDSFTLPEQVANMKRQNSLKDVWIQVWYAIR